MREYYFYASDDDDQPYKPLNNIDRETGQPIEDADELRHRKGPFFQCDGKNPEPHFHIVTSHPESGNSDQYIIRQLHVPGYDQHDGHVKSNFATMPPFNIVTGWHFVHPDSNQHMSEFSVNKKFPASMDNHEAFDLWKEHCSDLFGPGAIVQHPSGDAKMFFPGLENEKPKENEEQEMPEDEEQEMPEMEEQEMPKMEEKPAKFDAFGLKPGAKAFAIHFYPAKEYDDGVSPAFTRMKMYEGHDGSSSAQNSLKDYATKYDMIENMHKIRKSGEEPDAWEDLFKRSKKWFNR